MEIDRTVLQNEEMIEEIDRRLDFINQHKLTGNKIGEQAINDILYIKEYCKKNNIDDKPYLESYCLELVRVHKK